MRWHLLALTSLGWLTLGVPVHADDAPPAPAPSTRPQLAAGAMSGSAGSPVRRLRLPDGRCQDLFLSDGASREFTLSWRRVSPAGLTVLRDGQPLRDEADYTVDLDTGRLRLLHAPLSQTVLRVTYRPLPYLAESNAGNVPAAAPRGLAERLSLAGNARNSPTAAERGEVYLPLPPLEARRAAGDEAGGFDHLASGLRLTDVQERYTDGGTDTGSVSYVRADPFNPSAAASAREELSTDLNLRPSPGSQFLFSSYLAKESLFTDNYQELERQRLQFDQTWGKSTAALMWDHSSSTGYGMVNSLDALSLALTHPFTRSTSADLFFSDERSLSLGQDTRGLFTLHQLLGPTTEAQASALYRMSSLSGSTLESAYRLFAHPTATSDVSLQYAQSSSDAYGLYQKMSADATAALGNRVQVQGEISQRYSDQLGSIFNVGFGVAARPIDHAMVEASVSQSQGSTTGAATSQTVRFTLDPSSVFKLQLGYDGIQSQQDGSTQNGLWLVELGGKNYVKLEGYAGFHTGTDKILYNDSLYGLEIKPADALTFNSSLRQVWSDTARNSVADFGATLRLLRGVEVSALYRRPTEQWDAPNVPQAGDVKLSLAPVQGFRIFGQYSLRPPDQTGALLDEIHRSLGLETRLGSFSVQGSITRVDGVLATDAGQQLDFLASLSLFKGGTRLYGGFRTQESFLTDQTRSQIYRFGISQTAGQSLFLTLEGQFGWQQTAGGPGTLDPDQTLAQARVGLRF